MMKKLIDSYAFDLSPRVPLQLGRESIASSSTAITELVKNSYDADSKSVEIRFFKLNCPLSVLVIEDDGNGMTPEMLINSWLKIGTENKVKNTVSAKGRVLTGAKGLGRLGIDRLCRKMILQTKSVESDSVLQLEIDWKKYESSDQSFFDIKHKLYSIPFPHSDKYGECLKKGHGTRILLLGLKDDWNGYLASDLRRDLRLLVSPFFANDEFQIKIADDGDESKALNSSEILDYSRWSITSSINDDLSISAEFRHNGNVVDTINSTWEKYVLNRGAKPHCGPLEFKLYFIPRESVADIDLKVKHIRSFMDANQGVRIYRDNFRVRPYGEPSGKGDWLDLGMRRIKNPEGMKQGNWKVGPNQIVGAVFINRDKNHSLNDQANREGIVENESFYDMRSFVIKVIEHFESLAIVQAQSESVPKPIAVLEDIKNRNNKTNSTILELQKKLNETIKKKDPKKKELRYLAKQMLNVANEQEKKTEEFKELVDRMEHLKDTMANLASLGILTVCLGHETRQHTSMSSMNIAVLRKMLEGDIEHIDLPKSLQRVNALENSIKYISDFAGFALSNVKLDKRRMTKLNFKTLVNDVNKIFSQSLDKSNVIVVKNWDDGKEYNVKGYQIHWESIIINFLTNSLWALEGKPVGARFIKISLDLIDDNKQIELRFSDSGRGIEKGTEDRIFDTGYSTKKDPKGTATGTGMGLAIVKDFVVDNHKGTLQVVSNGELGGAEFIINVPAYRG
ncbi:sensor histidine kinase [Enterobacter ludwigii]|uniref:sensor histidine kinase n=1 Tax=Enterobacter ludwigii TaxID=299767 RepID=UPI002FD720C5